MRRTALFLIPMILQAPLALAAPAAPQSAPEPSLVSFSSGALIVQAPQEYGGGWSTMQMLDELPGTGWASPEGVLTPAVTVIALPERTLLKRLEFDTGSTDGENRGAKDVLVEVSDTSAKDGFKTVAQVSLKDKTDRQKFPVSTEVPGRWVRLTIKNNHGAKDYLELMDFRAYGTQLTHTPFPDVSGTYETDYGDFHLRQQGTSVTGCYEHDEGVLDGGIEGRIMKFTWREAGDDKGPAIMVFSPDGKQMFGLWWNEGGTDSPGGQWNGKKKTNTVGTCPHWSGGAQEQMAKDLQSLGRARIYGINFDSDSDVIKDESKPTLDRIAALLKAKPDWKLTIEGHTDSTATAEHNLQLSKRRAEAVKAYLQTAGIDGARLKAVGLGATKPVASNDTGTGRAQNRRVELVKG
ncbi:MAG TPA: OmpA family protein [Thermoanaerobaculia bacterium]|jgi:outer membrane protein OmpA-like peptidoglycan-associated protein|nr:OmpA family protein [Thermoanaerobaculia bacterium]